MSSEGGGISAEEPDNHEKVAGRGHLIIVSAPSGAGKSTLVQKALSSIERLRYSISYTTRKARGTEKHGVDYYFVTEAEFRAIQERGEFLEFAEVHGCLYGTPESGIREMLAGGFDVILDIDVQGAEQIRRRVPEAVTVFIMPPSFEILESRLRSRNLNDPADLERRLRNAADEVRLYKNFKYVIVNGEMERAASSLEAIIAAERQRVERQEAIAQDIIDTFGGESLNV